MILGLKHWKGTITHVTKVISWGDCGPMTLPSCKDDERYVNYKDN